MIDRHLVMNALSRLVAQEPDGEEAELLYSLSDYLHAALGDLPDVAWPMQREWALVENALPLRACVVDSAVTSTLRNRCPPDLRLPRGLLVAVMDAALQGCTPKRGGRWVLLAEAAPWTGRAGALVLRLRITPQAPEQTFDAAQAAGRIEAVLRRPGVAAALEGRVAALSPDTLECRLAPWPAAPQDKAIGSLGA